MNFLGFLVVFLPALVTAQQQSLFTVVAPYSIRQGKPYDIFVRGFNLTKTVSLTISIFGTTEQGAAVNITRVANISPQIARAAIQISTNTITKGNYFLAVNGENYYQKRSLNWNSRKYVYLIQFNKAIHLPNDTVQYRIFVVDSETYAVNPNEPNNINITGPKGNLVESLKNVTFVNGKYENKFQLAPKTNYGNWTLKFQSGDEIVEKNFEVAEYKLPMVTGKLVISKYNLYSTGKISGSIEISYAFNGDPIGVAQLNVYRYGQRILEKHIPISSKKTPFELSIVNELRLTSQYNEKLEANLTFVDSLTEEQITDIKEFNIATRIYSIFIDVYNKGYLKPGFPYKFTISVRKYDGSPAPAGTKLQVIPQSPSSIPPQSVILGIDGIVTTSVEVPITASYLQLRVTATDADDGYHYAYLPASRTGSFLDVEVANQNCMTDPACLKINEPVNVKLTSGDIVDFAIVHILSKGVLLKSLTIRFDSDLNEDNDPKTVYFSFTPTIWYVPYVKVLAYYVNSNGKIVIGQAEFKISNGLPNYVKIRSSEKEVRPGADAKFNIESYINSTVSLVAVDQRALLLRSNGNITKDHVFNEFDKFNWNNVNYDWNNVVNYEYAFGSYGLLIISNIPGGLTSSPVFASFGADSSYLGQEVSNFGHLEIRNDFKETFLWRDVDIKSSIYGDYDYTDETSQFGFETITEKVPESISNYYIYGVAMSSTKGLGLPEDIPSVSIFLPFFVSVEFPYSVKRAETLIQDIIIYNYLTQSQTVEVRISSHPNYQAVDLVAYGWTAAPGYYTKKITTQVGQHVELKFGIKPTERGLIPFEITARGLLAGDGIEKQLRVIPEGVPRTITRTVFMPIEYSNIIIKENLQCNLPVSAYLDTVDVFATVTGDLMGKPLKNIENLIQFPSGCCEQTASKLIPNIIAYLYLSLSNKLTPALKNTLQTYISYGYQNLLRCQNYDGSYSVFSYGNPSTWVTAFIIQNLKTVSTIITVDPNIVTRGANYLISQQNADGSFRESGGIVYYSMQAGSRNGIALTAFCSIFFSSIIDDYPQYIDARDKSVAYLERYYSTVTSTYELGIIAYALQVAYSGRAGTVYNMFYSKRTETSTTIHWSLPKTQPDMYQYMPPSQDIEVTSYGLMTLIDRGESLPRIMKIVQYLISQSNLYGGFGSSHDTVMALNALTKFSLINPLNGNVSVSLIPNIGTAIESQVTPYNSMTLQSFELDSATRNLTAYASTTSSGLAIVGLTCTFYEDSRKIVPQFNITYRFNYFYSNQFNMNICVKYIPPGMSNMAILVVSMPSGFIGYTNSQNEGVRLTEVTNQETEITFYYDNIDNNGYCVTIYGYLRNFVTNLKDGLISAFDYYDTSKQGFVSYPIPK